jgi:hypothetical protein
MSTTPAIKPSKPYQEPKASDLCVCGVGFELGQDTDYLDCRFLLCPSVPQGKYKDCTLN